jgi:hypothetical protein
MVGVEIVVSVVGVKLVVGVAVVVLVIGVQVVMLVVGVEVVVLVVGVGMVVFYLVLDAVVMMWVGVVTLVHRMQEVVGVVVQLHVKECETIAVVCVKLDHRIR